MRLLSLLTLTAAPVLAQALPTGQTWTLHRAGNLRTSPTVQRAEAPTLRFEGGRVTGTTGCNTFTGTYTVTQREVRLSPLATTRRACANDVATALEARYLRTLGSVRRFSLSGPVLLLATDRGETLVFRQK